MIVSKDEAIKILHNCHKGWRYIESEVTDYNGDTVLIDSVFECISTGKYFLMSWEEDTQEVNRMSFNYCEPFEDNEVKLIEVRQVEKIWGKQAESWRPEE